jgi:hypothetical protein
MPGLSTSPLILAGFWLESRNSAGIDRIPAGILSHIRKPNKLLYKE